jgi:ABC-type Fe3+ transport system substrate-binding protein
MKDYTVSLQHMSLAVFFAVAFVFSELASAVTFEEASKSLEGLAPAERQARVVKEAEKEGRVRWSSSTNLDRVEPLLAAWKKKYQRIHIEYHRLSGRKLADRAINEYRASRYEYSNVLAITCNLHRVKSPPGDWAEFSQPRWRGDFSIDTERFQWFRGLQKLYGEEGAKKLLAGFVANGALVRRGGTLQAQLVAASEYSCTISAYRDFGNRLTD